ncbi:MAG: gamma-glutamylcyclotransferase (GGCT)/AIG2-like uncharacterized protein YtfP [Planctomycetota bacterium]|jgi:gamma-glutamylcyclotransferase (GGCT)/AIG2-like uncharacterized protein YtfP
MKYFAYGTNCSPAVLERKAVRFRSRARASLPGHRLIFNKRALREQLPDDIGFANVEEAPDAVVEGILYELDPEDLERLDESERSPEHYERVEVSVETEAGGESAFTYLARPEVTAEGLRPSRNYLKHILEAGDFLSRSYYDALVSWQTYAAPCSCCDKEQEVVFVRGGDRMYVLCQPCREARHAWSGTLGRRMTVPEARAVMQLARERGGFGSLRELIDEAISAAVLKP